MTTRVYSERLGAISDGQLDAAVQRANLGQFVAAAPVQTGLFGQNLFLTTTTGEFVLRGAPHWVNGAPNEQWQFTKEAFFARLLHEGTDVPVPWPQHYDTGNDIFGWPYVIMPRLQGVSLSDRLVRKTLALEEQHEVAWALGEGLARLQVLHWPQAGEIDPSLVFSAYPHGFRRHLAGELELMAAAAAGNGAICREDRDWIAGVIDAASMQCSSTVAVYVHADYKLDNLVMDHAGGEWSVSGIFDLHTSCFGDGAYDVCRQVCSYLDRDEDLARTFIEAWKERSQVFALDPAAITLYLANERMKIWEYFTRPAHRDAWTGASTFVEFARPYAIRLLALLDS